MQTFDHVIVGGGIVGASIAWHLASERAGKVLLLERNELASAASSRAAGLVLQVSAKKAKTPLAKLTRDTLPRLEDVLGESVGFHPVGSLRIAASAQTLTGLEAMVLVAAEHDIAVQWLSGDDAHSVAPWLDPAAIEKAAFFPGDGYVDPYLLTMSYARAARRQGAVLRPRTAVTDVLIEHGRVLGVRTDTEQIACANVIDAAGVWAALVSARAGYPIPMAPVRSHYWITPPSSEYGGEQPVTVLPDVAAYTRPEVGGLLLGIQEPASATFDARDLPADPDAFSPSADDGYWDALAAAAEPLARIFPGIMKAQFSSYICGLSAYTPDGEIILGPVPDVSGFYVAAGCCGSGVTLSAGLGSAVTDTVMGRRTGFDIECFRPDRFGKVDPFSAAFRARCAAARAAKSGGNLVDQNIGNEK